MTSIDLAFRKFDGSASWSWTGELASWNADGVRALVPAGTEFSRDGASYRSRVDCALLVPFRSWWCARFYDTEPHGITAYVDLIAPVPPAAPARALALIDLDLDVVVEGGAVRLEDEDEFTAGAAAMAYPARVVQQVQAAATRLVAAHGLGEPPFDRDPRGLVDEVRRLAAEGGNR